MESRFSLVVSMALLREGRATVPDRLECVRQAALLPSRPRRLVVELVAGRRSTLETLRLDGNQISGECGGGASHQCDGLPPGLQ